MQPLPGPPPSDGRHARPATPKAAGGRHAGQHVPTSRSWLRTFRRGHAARRHSEPGRSDGALRARKQKPARQASGDRTGTLRADPCSPRAPREDGAADANRLRQPARPQRMLRWERGGQEGVAARASACGADPRQQAPGALQGMPAHESGEDDGAGLGPVNASDLQRCSRQGRSLALAPVAKPRLRGRNPPGHAGRRCAPAAAPRAAG